MANARDIPLIDNSSHEHEEKIENEPLVLPLFYQQLFNTFDAVPHRLQKMHELWKSVPNARMGINVKKYSCGEKIIYAKYGIERYYNSKRLKKVIKKYNLFLLNIPNKYIYTFDKNSEPTNENSIVICEGIDGVDGTSCQLNKNQFEQLYTFVIKAQYYKMHRLNYKVSNDGIVHIIDTGNEEVVQKEEAIRLREDYIKNGNGIHDGHGIRMDPFINDPITQFELSNYTSNRYGPINDEAGKWFYEKITQREKVRLELKLSLENGTKTIHDLLEFDDDLYQ
jgi:hypothetical protein